MGDRTGGSTISTAPWITDARRALLRQAATRPAWGYRPGGEAFVEPTVLACFGLLASAGDADTRETADIVRRAAAWVASLQRTDGAVGLSAELNAPCWGTALAVLLWATQAEMTEPRRRAMEWLVRQEGRTSPNGDDIIGHDRTIAGWSWVDGTHSWLEPTALAILALARVGSGTHRRTQDGLRLIRDREVPGGGWNFGNTLVFGHAFRPQPGPTGLALLALAAAHEPRTAAVERGCRYLESELVTLRSAQSLCWGLLGLTAWNRRPAAADEWLAAAFDPARSRADAPLQLAYLLLASSPTAPALFGLASD